MHSTIEVAKMLGCSRETVVKHIEAGNLQAHNISTTKQRVQWRISKDAILKFLDLRSSQPKVKAVKRKRLPDVPKRYS